MLIVSSANVLLGDHKFAVDIFIQFKNIFASSPHTLTVLFEQEIERFRQRSMSTRTQKVPLDDLAVSRWISVSTPNDTERFQ